MFDMVANLLKNPLFANNTGDLGAMLGVVQQIANEGGGSPETTQALLGIVGRYVQTGLQAHQQTNGIDATQSLVNSLGGTDPNAAAISALLDAPQVDQMLGEIESRTGIAPGTIESILPMAVPLVLNFLKSNDQGNSLLSGYLDQDADGDIDLSDLMGLAMKYINR